MASQPSPTDKHKCVFESAGEEKVMLHGTGGISGYDVFKKQRCTCGIVRLYARERIIV